jgi:serine/threonine protein kinase
LFSSIFLEYAQTVHATTYGDVYSFGVVLLEMLIGKRPTDPMFEGELSIISFVERKFPDQVLDIIDAHVQEECKGFNKVTVEQKMRPIDVCYPSCKLPLLARFDYQEKE